MAFKKPSKWDISRNNALYGRKMYQVTASSLKHYGAVYDPGTPVDDGVGGFTYPNNVKRFDAWMSIQQLRAEQVFDYRGKDIAATHIIKVRYEIDIKETDLIVVEGVTYEVIVLTMDTDRKLFKTAMVTQLR